MPEPMHVLADMGIACCFLAIIFAGMAYYVLGGNDHDPR
jgi:hypothetical protein